MASQHLQRQKKELYERQDIYIKQQLLMDSFKVKVWQRTTGPNKGRGNA